MTYGKTVTVGFLSVVLKSGLFSVRFFKGSNATSANVAVHFLTVFYVGNLLHVHLKRSSRLTVGVANVVAACLTLAANVAYSGHIDTSDIGLIFLNVALVFELGKKQALII